MCNTSTIAPFNPPVCCRQHIYISGRHDLISRKVGAYKIPVLQLKLRHCVDLQARAPRNCEISDRPCWSRYYLVAEIETLTRGPFKTPPRPQEARAPDALLVVCAPTRWRWLPKAECFPTLFINGVHTPRHIYPSE